MFTLEEYLHSGDNQIWGVRDPPYCLMLFLSTWDGMWHKEKLVE